MIYQPLLYRPYLVGRRLWDEIREPEKRFVRFRQTKPIKPHPRWIWKFVLVLLAVPGAFTLPLLGLILLASNMISGMRVAAAAGGAVAAEHETGTFDLLAATPGGARYASWQLARGRVRRIRAYDSMRFYSRWLPWTMYIMGIVITILTTWTNLTDPYTPPTQLQVVFWIGGSIVQIIAGLSVAYALYLDGTYSVVTATLTGMIAANRIKTRGSAQAAILAGFFAVQSAAYVTMGVISGVLLFILNSVGILWDTIDGVLRGTALYPGWIGLTGGVLSLVGLVVPVFVVLLTRETLVRLLQYIHFKQLERL